MEIVMDFDSLRAIVNTYKIWQRWLGNSAAEIGYESDVTR